jgi:hypothetical protein
VWFSSNRYPGGTNNTVADHSLTLILKGIGGQCENETAQRKLFSVVENAVPTLLSRDVGLWDVESLAKSDFGASALEAFDTWARSQGGRNNDRGYWRHYRKHVYMGH